MEGVLPGAWQAKQPGMVAAPVPLKSIVCIVATFVPWHVAAKHEPETVCPVAMLAALWIVAKSWQVSHDAPPSRDARIWPARYCHWCIW